MKVNMYRSGGFAGIVMGWEVLVDQQPDRQTWVELVDSLPWGQSGGSEPNGADRFVYRFQVGRRSATVGETQLDGPWRELAERVREDGRRIPAKDLTVARASA